MSFVDILSRKARYERGEERLRRREAELILRERQTKEEIEKRRKLEAYERARKEKEVADERARLVKKQEQARVQAMEREEEARKKNYAYLVALAKQKEEELERSKLEFDRKIQELEAAQSRNDRDAQDRLTEERKKRDQVAQQLLQEREDGKEARRQDEAKKRAAEARILAKKRKIELEQERQKAELLEAERMRQREDLWLNNSPKALQELRDLIRARYELDMEIWRMRNIDYADRDLVETSMHKSDNILQLIRSRVENWTADAGFEPEEWEYAAEIKERLNADGKRIWAVEPPWPTEVPGA